MFGQRANSGVVQWAACIELDVLRRAAFDNGSMIARHFRAAATRGRSVHFSVAAVETNVMVSDGLAVHSRAGVFVDVRLRVRRRHMKHKTTEGLAADSATSNAQHAT